MWIIPTTMAESIVIKMAHIKTAHLDQDLWQCGRKHIRATWPHHNWLADFAHEYNSLCFPQQDSVTVAPKPKASVSTLQELSQKNMWIHSQAMPGQLPSGWKSLFWMEKKPCWWFKPSPLAPSLVDEHAKGSVSSSDNTSSTYKEMWRD